MEFERTLIPFKVFSLTEARKAFPGFDSKRLVEWQERGYIKKLINKWYLFADIPLSEPLLYRISNCLHHPSYISMESALSHYNLIPEGVYSHQAISTRKTVTYHTPAGTFQYRAIKPELYFGYHILNHEGLPILMAELEKALLDYCYLNARLNTLEDMQALRLNVQELQSRLDREKLHRYAAVFNSATVNKRIKILQKLISDAHTA